MMLYLLLLPVFFLLLLGYFRLADHFNIIDKPNERSSHRYITIRGAGIIFFMAALCYFFVSHFSYSLFFYGLLIISIISFIDDMIVLPNRIRILAHLVAVSFLFWQLNVWTFSWYWLVIAFILIIGLINTYNFMDGINGITGGYSLVILVSLWYLNTSISFIDQRLIILLILADIVFLFFNFRKRAKCFAGDVGSVSMAFVLIFLTLKLILITGNYSYILFFSVYGTDSILTIIRRLMRKENIFKAHRSHLYQYLANEMHWGHLLVTAFYVSLQLLINWLLINMNHQSVARQWMGSLIILIILALAYMIAVYFIKRSKRSVNIN